MDVDTPTTPTPTVRSATNVPRTGPTPTPRSAAATAPASAPATTPMSAPVPRGGTRPSPTLSSPPSEAPRIRCPICRRPHRLQHCGIFRSMRPLQRQQVAQAHGHCLNCLSHTHGTQECVSTGLCQICSRPHHTLLHRISRRDVGRPPTLRSRATGPRPSTRAVHPRNVTPRRRQPRPQPRRSTGLSSVVATLQQLQRLLG